MRLFVLAAALNLVVGAHLCIAATGVKSIDDLATHQQNGVIEIDGLDGDTKINAFCLNAKGHIVAACGNGPGQVRIANDDGKVLASWSIHVKPEAIAVADDGTILVGGEGELFRFDGQGKELLVANSPHADKLRDSDDELRKIAIANLESRRNPAKSRVVMYKTMIEQLEERAAKGDLNASEERTLKMLPQMLKLYSERAKAEEDDADSDGGPKETEIQEQVESLIRTKMRISSITSSGNQVFVATRAIEGYGYDVWRMNDRFTDAKIVVAGLSGCCGQMDVQCCEKGLFVAENSRDRVVHYDFDGEQVTKWGKSDRTGIDGFTSCCNPMNVCFDASGDVYTAEATTGRIKRFSSTGELAAYVGDVDLVPGCKNVSIAVSPVNDNIYMLDLTRNHIKVMQPKKESKPISSDVDKTAKKKTAASKRKPSRSLTSSVLSLFGLGR